VIAHAYYADLWPLLRDRLTILSTLRHDLFATVCGGDAEDLAGMAKADFPQARVLRVINRGRDVAPFLYVAAHADRLGYKYVLKLHTKKSPHRPAGHNWLQQILSCLVPEDRGQQAQLADTLRSPETGVVGPRGQYLALPVNYPANRRHLLRMLSASTSGARAREVDANKWDYGFFAGSMFWARLDALRPLIRLRLRINDFEAEAGQIDGTTAHALERAFSLVPEVNRRAMFEISPSGIACIDYKTDNIPEWSDLYRGKPTTEHGVAPGA